MLKATVGLSRKISKDYNSTGYSVNLDGEIPVSVDDAQAVVEKVRELFSLAEEALNREIERENGQDANGRREEARPTPPQPSTNGHHNGNGQPAPIKPAAAPTNSNPPVAQSAPTPPAQSQSNARNGQSNGTGESASNKQVQFLLNMAKRFKLTPPLLEGRIAEIIGRRSGVYELTKKEAGQVLDHFTNSPNGNGKH
jgi:hypothetical protein